MKDSSVPITSAAIFQGIHFETIRMVEKNVEKPAGIQKCVR